MKKRTVKRLLSSALVAIMTASMLAGCGGEPASTGDGGAAESKAEESSRAPAESSEETPSDSGEAEAPAESGEEAQGAEALLLEPYEEPVEIHVVLQYRESEDPETPTDVTPETSTAVKLLSEELNINLVYDWIVNADQFSQKFGAEMAAGNIPDVVMLSPNDFEDLASQGGLIDLKNSPPEVQNAMSDEEKTEWHSYVYTWLPYRIYSPTCLRQNFEVINQYAKDGKTEISVGDAPRNNEFWGSWASYLNYAENPDDGVAWGTYFSRLAENGGVDNMIKTVETADIIYDEVYVTTPSMISKQGELDKLRDNTYISIIMGETPVDGFDTFVEQWKAQGGDDIAREVNEWYQNK